MRQMIGSGSPWEDIVGYSRAVRIGNMIEVSGTTAMDGNQLKGKGDVYLQTKHIFEKIDRVLQQLGATLTDVIRTRMYVTNIAEWEKVAQAHNEVFAQIKPTTTMVEVRRLIHDELLIEIEVTALLG